MERILAQADQRLPPVNKHAGAGMQDSPSQKAAPSHESSSATPLLLLPPELRLIIYDYLFASILKSDLQRSQCYPLPSVLRVCTLLRAEGLNIWMQCLTAARLDTQARYLDLPDRAERRAMRLNDYPRYGAAHRALDRLRVRRQRIAALERYAKIVPDLTQAGELVPAYDPLYKWPERAPPPLTAVERGEVDKQWLRRNGCL